MYLIKIHVTYKESILDPQGQSVCQAAHRLGFTSITDIRMGKYFEVTASSQVEVDSVIEQLCEQLLVNHTMETYTYEVLEVNEVLA